MVVFAALLALGLMSITSASLADSSVKARSRAAVGAAPAPTIRAGVWRRTTGHVSALAPRAHLASGHRLEFGLADYEPKTFADPRVAELGVHFARDVVPWNVALVKSDLAQVTAWLTAVKKAKITPLITFEHADHSGRAPTPAQFLAAFEKFRKLFPWVNQFCPWDEATHAGQPTQHNPKLAAQYYNEMVGHCSKCLITAPDTLDADGNIEGWIHTFLQTARPYPQIWPFNPYVSISIDSSTLIYRFLEATHGQVWFSEIGGVVWWRFKGKLIYHGEAYAANVARNLFKLSTLSPRITRIYYYHWRSPGNPHRLKHTITWDSGLIQSDGYPRPALFVVARELDRYVQVKRPKNY